MLILTRKRDESIIINDDIKITILEIENNRIQLGIDAPKSVAIHREEVYREIQDENRRAVVKANNMPEDLSKIIKKRAIRPKDEENGG